MITMRRYFGPKRVPIAAPGLWASARFKQQSSQSSSSPIKGLSQRGGFVTQQRRGIERIAVAIMLLIAWAWIMVFFGMIFYHGYQYNNNNSSSAKTTTSNDGDQIIIQQVNNNKKIVQEPAAAIISSVDKTIIEKVAAAVVDESSKQEKQRRIVQKSTNSGVNNALSSSSSSNTKLLPNESPLLIFTCQRENYLRETLIDVLNYIPSDCSIGCPVIVSQDGKNEQVDKVITEFEVKFQQEKNIPLIHIQHKTTLRRGSHNSYEALAVHYGWALRYVFDGKYNKNNNDNNNILPQRIIILEEDIHISPDFFSYFTAMTPLLEHDNTLLAVSAFNDNGFMNHVYDAKRVLRSDFFPGLGWMLLRKLWINELQIKWPTGYWDDWLRDPTQRQNRHILRPEISRTFHFGIKGGASNNQFGNQLSKIVLNKDNINWNDNIDKSNVDNNNKNHWSYYLRNEEIYDNVYWKLINNAELVTNVDDARKLSEENNVRIEYNTINEFKQLARNFNLMDDEKAGIPRTAYKGVVETRLHGDEHFLFLTPPINVMKKEFLLSSDNDLSDSNTVVTR